MRKALSVILILAAILMGAMFGHFSFLKQKGTLKSVKEYFSYLAGAFEKVPRPEPVGPEGLPITKEKEKPVPTPETSLTETQIIKPPSTKSAQKPKTTVDMNLVSALLGESEQLYKKMNYKESAQKSRQLISLLENGGLEDSDLHRQAVQIEMRSRAFGALISKIPPNTLSDGKDLEAIQLDTGRTIIVRVLKEDLKTGALTIQQNDGIQATLSEDLIVKRNPITRKEYLKNRAEELERKIASARKDQYFDMLSLALFAIQNRLTDRVTELLEKAFAIDGSEFAYETFYTEPDKAEMVAILLASFGRGEKVSARTTKAQPPAPPLEESSSIPPEPVPGKEDLRLARGYLARGQYYAMEATLYPEKRFQLGPEAKKYVEKAVDVLNKLLEEKPGDPELEQSLREANGLLYHINHNLVLAVEK